MANRLKNITFKPDRQMERGESQDFISNNGVNSVTAIKWKDTKGVLALSSIAGSNPVTTVKRWDKNAKLYRYVNCPHAIAQYNQKMGGVDLVDQMMEYYRCFFKTFKWTVKVANHFIDLALVNAWMEYRLDCVARGVRKKQIKDLLDFKIEVACGLLASLKRSRPETSDEEEIDEAPFRPNNITSPLPCIGKRYDGFGHWPNLDSLTTARTCRLEFCKSRTRTRCEKCSVYLCLSGKNNCFKRFHVK